MFNDVDETLKQLLIAEVPIDRAEVDITFERPTREWSGRLSKPTLNLFLFDIRERLELRDTTFMMSRMADGRGERRRPARRVDLSYMVTAWAREPEDEHRILGRVLACMYRFEKAPEEVLQGYLRDAPEDLLVRALPPDHLARPHDMWGVLDNELRSSLTWVATAPVDAFVPIVGPLVRTAEVTFSGTAGDNRETFPPIVGGIVHAPGDPLAGLANVRVSLQGTAHQATTNAEGKWVFLRVARGEHVLVAEAPDGRRAERRISVPSETYDIEL